MANSQSACGRACQVESEFLCRSYLYRGAPTGADYNCQLYHLDHLSLPAGAKAFANSKAQVHGLDSKKNLAWNCTRKFPSLQKCVKWTIHEASDNQS